MAGEGGCRDRSRVLCRAAPLTAKGRFALARVLLADGDRLAASREVKAAWRSEELGEATEEMAYEEFRELLAREDHRARMDKRIGAKEISAAMRAAKRLGDDDVAIVKACAAVKGDADKALGKLNDVPEDARGDLGYVLCRVKWAMKKDRIVDAARMVIAAAPETMAQQDTDEWWRDRRTLARKLLDMGEFQMAYDVVRDAATPGLRPTAPTRLHGGLDRAALPQRSRHRAPDISPDIDKGLSNPIALARANYWRARAAEAVGDARADAFVLRDFRQISDRLLRAAVADKARHRERSSCGRRQTRRTRPRRPINACAPSTCSMRSASATCR